MAKVPAPEALHRLREGNRRFVSGDVTLHERVGGARRGELVAGQAPFAAVVGCSDSRVPVEVVFDQGLGDLFVIRVAGNIAGPSQVGSVEFAAEKLGTRLVVVLGHTRCGAVGATLDHLRAPAGSPPGSLGEIVDRVRPPVERLLETDLRHDPEALGREAVRANVRAAADRLRHGSDILRRLVRAEKLLVVGAVYSLETGRVDFFDGFPGTE